jgi:hypothetical protein
VSRGWEPLLGGAEADRALEIVRGIANDLGALPPPSERGLEGAVGQAVFLAHAEAAGIVEGGRPDAMLEAELERLSEGVLPLGLWSGYSGIRWALSYLGAGDELVAQLDEGIAASLATAPWTGPRDVYYGLAGIALAYAGDGSATASRIIEGVIGHLEAARGDGAGENGGGELGVAHGEAGVMGALACCASTGSGAASARRLLQCLLERLPPRLADVAPAIPQPAGARLGWCRGELAISLALLATARALDDPAREDDAVAAALDTTAPPDDPALDACLCHGAAGIAHLYNRLYQATGRTAFADRARAWLRRTMGMQRPGTGIGGFEMRRREGGRVWWEADPSLLIGSAGVGLALLAGATTQAPDWDRVLAGDVGADGAAGDAICSLTSELREAEHDPREAALHRG